MTQVSTPDREQAVRQIYDQAHSVFQAGDGVEAEALLRQALPRFRNEPNLMCLLGEVCLSQRRPQEALAWFERVLKIVRDFPRALEGRGLALMADKRAREAIESLQKVVVAAPQRYQARLALARAQAMIGQAAEADQSMREAMQLNPQKAALLKAEAALHDGDMRSAEEVLKKLLAEDPDNANALRLLGNIALEANRFKAAQRMLQRAVELAPRMVLAWNDLANLYMKQDRYEQALEATQQAIAVDTRMAHSYVMQGNILTKAQRHEESLAAYQQALEISPANAGALSGMGHVLKTIGRQAESIAAFRQCIQAHPAFGEAYWSLANLKTFDFSNDEVAVMEKMAAEADLPDEPKINFFLSLGKHYENEKNFDRSFDFYRQGNELRRNKEIYDPVLTQVLHDRIIEVFSTELFAQHKGSGDPDPAPILIVGLPRSGSTLLEQILASHSQVEGTMELPDLSRAIGKINRQAQRHKKANASSHAEYPEALLDLDEEALRELGQGYLRTTQRYRTGKLHFIDKMPNNFASIGLLRLILPNAKVINARRHPLDSCLGSYKQLFFKGQSFTYDQFELGQYYLQYQRLMDHWHSVLPGHVLDVHYEQMVFDQEAQTRRMLDYLDLPWEDACLRFYETERAINTASSEQVRQPIYTKAINYWRHYEKHLEELVETLQPLLQQLPEADQPDALRQQEGAGPRVPTRQ